MADFSNKVIYQIYPKSFKDSNGDGIGDLRGVAEKLDYLKDLGVDYLWLTPFFVSPQRDNGYDVADYRNIDPMFGTMEDLDNLIAEGEKRNIGLMFDMVFNHTSTSHEWFRRALAGEKKYQDYYIFKEGAPDQPPTNWQSRERILSSVGTIPLIVNNLVKMNYVERMCNEKDRRVCILHLTQEGYDVISKIVPRNEAMIAESMEVLDQEEKEKLLYLLKKIGGKL